jgi:hypothetical protein
MELYRYSMLIWIEEFDANVSTDLSPQISSRFE